MIAIYKVTESSSHDHTIHTIYLFNKLDNMITVTSLLVRMVLVVGLAAKR